MRLDKNLNLIFPHDLTTGTGYVYSMPISRNVFEVYYAELGHVFTQCISSNDSKYIGITAPQLALPALKKYAKDIGNWDTPNGVKNGLINEMIRLTSIGFVGKNGWETLPMDIAIKRKIVDEDIESEVLSNLVFTCAISKVAPRGLSVGFLEMAGSPREWQSTSSNFMEFLNSLPTLTTEEVTTKKRSAVVS